MSDTPPQNLDAEENIIGAMMLSSRAIEAVVEHVKPDDFYRQTHGTIFRTCLDLWNQGKPVDALTVADELTRRNQIEHVGGKVRIHELAHLTPATANVARYAEIVRDCATRRRLMTAGNEIARIGLEGNDELPNLLEAAETELTRAIETTSTSDFVSAGSTADEYVSRIVKAHESGEDLTGLMTRYHDLDELLSGFYGGQLIVLAARPSVGKSALALNVADNIADKGTPVAFYALEMSKEEIVSRQIARLTKIPSDRMKRPKQLDLNDINKLKTAAQLLRERPFYIDDNPGSTLTEVRTSARRAIRQHKLGLLVVDYLQLFAGDGRKSDNRQNEVADISRGLKLLAKELNIPVLAISQLSRKVDDRPDKRPVLSDLRDSGAIEQDADVVLFLYREELYKIVDPEKARDAELIVAKNRNGETGTVNLLWFPRRQYFGEPARHVQEAAA